MAKTAFDAARQTIFLFPPEELVLVDDPAHPLYQGRVHLPVSEQLVRSMLVKGFRSVIIVRRDGDKGLVVDGRQRVKAACEANRRLVAEGKEPLRVRAYLERGDDADLFGVMVLSNKGRQDDDPMAEAQELKRFLDMGRSEEEAAAIFCVPTSRVRQMMTLFDLAPKVQKAVSDGKVSISAAAKMAKLDSADQVERLDELLAAGNGKATVAKVARAVKRNKSGTLLDAFAPEKPSPKQIKRGREALTSAGMDEAAAALEWVMTGTCSIAHVRAKLAGPDVVAAKGAA